MHAGNSRGCGLRTLHLCVRLLLQAERVGALLLRRNCTLQLPLEALRVQRCEESEAVAGGVTDRTRLEDHELE